MAVAYGFLAKMVDSQIAGNEKCECPPILRNSPLLATQQPQKRFRRQVFRGVGTFQTPIKESDQFILGFREEMTERLRVGSHTKGVL